MKRYPRLLALALLLAGLAACAAGEPVSPDPLQVYAAIEEEVALPAMVDMGADYLEMNLGIAPGECDGAVYYMPEAGVSPDEIAIIRAVDEEGAEKIRAALETRLAYKERSAQQYLTENMPIIQAGIIRRDGLTVSLIVSEKAEEINAVFDEMPGN